MKPEKKKYEMQITVEHPQIVLGLFLNGKLIEEKKWQDRSNLSKKLLFEIDELLKAEKIEKKDLGKIKVNSSQESFSSTRIAKAIALAGNFCLEKNNLTIS